jgi:hypothetical protein
VSRGTGYARVLTEGQASDSWIIPFSFWNRVLDTRKPCARGTGLALQMF